jgi:hypothetical protein
MTGNERMAQLYLDGATIREIAKAFHCGEGTVATILRAQGVEIRPPGRRTVEEVAAAAKRLREVDLAFDGEWVRDGLIWRPVARPAEDAYSLHRRRYHREHKRAQRAGKRI